MTEDVDTLPVRWAGGRAVVTFPGHIDVSNASQIGDQLLSLISRGATELIADMSATVSCDHAGAATVARAYQWAAANGTPLRLVITAETVRRVLSLNGLDRVIPVYPSLDAAAAGAERRDAPGEREIAGITPAVPGTADTSSAAGQADSARELLDWVVNSIFAVGVLLEGEHELPRDAATTRITEALHRLDDVVREVRDHVLAQRVQAVQSSFAPRSPLAAHQRPEQATDRLARLQERVAQTARALQSAAGNTAALLQQQAGLAGPAQIDYPTEIKRWRAFADQAEQMANRWEQRP